MLPCGHSLPCVDRTAKKSLPSADTKTHGKDFCMAKRQQSARQRSAARQRQLKAHGKESCTAKALPSPHLCRAWCKVARQRHHLPCVLPLPCALWHFLLFPFYFTYFKTYINFLNMTSTTSWQCLYPYFCNMTSTLCVKATCFDAWWTVHTTCSNIFEN